MPWRMILNEEAQHPIWRPSSWGCPVRSRRAGHGCSTGARPGQPSHGPRTVALRAVAPDAGEQCTRLGDVPGLAAAIERARLDVRAHEHTEAYWRAVWGSEAAP